MSATTCGISGTDVAATDVELGKVPSDHQAGTSEKFSLAGSSKKSSQITLDWVNLSYKTDGEKGAEPKTLLHPMSGRAAPGEMVAIMGTSGAGKVRISNFSNQKFV